MIFSDMHEECGVFGIYNHPDAAQMTYLGSMRFSTAARNRAGSR